MVLVLLGVVAALIAALADPLGIGGSEGKFGWKQGVLLGIGIVVIIAGAATALRSPGGGAGTTPS
jgi:hypothetical protein